MPTRCSWPLVTLLASLAGCTAAAPAEDVAERSSGLTFANDQAAFDYFLGKGLSAIQAAGIVGNLDQESGVDPTSVQLGGGAGRGIAQWSVGGRWDTAANDNAKSYASTHGASVLSLSLQLDFIWYELTTFPSYGLAALKSASTITAATVAFQNKFEGCGTCDQSQRVAFAQSVFAAFGMDVVDGGAPPPDGATPGCVVAASNASGACIDVAACALLGGLSTKGLCPGGADIQCCTMVSEATGDLGPDAVDAGTSGGDEHGCSAAGRRQSGGPSVLVGIFLLVLTFGAAARRRPTSRA